MVTDTGTCRADGPTLTGGTGDRGEAERPSKRLAGDAGEATKLPPVIAIYGVGNHEPDKVAGLVRRAFGRAQLTADISELSWDKSTEIQRVAEGIQLLDSTAASVWQTAKLPLIATDSKIDRLLQRIEEIVYQSVLRFLVAAGLSILVIGPPLWLLFLAAPGSITVGNFVWMRPAGSLILHAGIWVFLALLGISLLRSFVTRSVRPTWVTVRRVILLLLQPLILLLTVPFSSKLGGWLVSFVRGLLPLALISVPFSLLFGALSGQFKAATSDIGMQFLFLIGVALVGGLQLISRKFWIGGPLKVTLDVTRYMGDPKYRIKLQEELDQRIRDLPRTDRGGRSVVLYAHSLGSVIALDSLVNSPVWEGTDEVLLVTFGSPIKRYFVRAFPLYLFPPSIQRSGQVVACRLGRFTWINLYRRWDYVGTQLGLDRTGVGMDRCTGQGWRLLRSHSGYWDDDVVVQNLVSCLKTVRPVPPPQCADSRPLIPTAPAGERDARIRYAVRMSAIVLFALMLVLQVVYFVIAQSEWFEEAESSVQTVQQLGVPAIADVSYFRTYKNITIVVGDFPSNYTVTFHHFIIRLPQPLGELPPIKIRDDDSLNEHARRFNYKALATYILENCAGAEGKKCILENCAPSERKKWYQRFRSQTLIPCTRAVVAVRYDPKDPNRILFPQFPARRITLGDKIGGFFGSEIWVAPGFAIAIFCGIPLFLWFLGLKCGADTG